MVEEHQWLAPAITAVTAALGVFVAGLAASIAVIKAVEIAQKALNAALNSNPYILVATAIAAVIAALTVLAVTLKKTESEQDNLSASSRRQYDEIQRLNAEYEKACEIYGETSAEAQLLKKQIDEETASFEANKRTIEDVRAKTDALLEKQREINKTYSEAAVAVDKNEASYLSLYNRLQELMSVEHKTVGTKQEILAVVELLNDAIPELGLAYDEYSDSLNMTADSIMHVIEAEIQAEKYQANHDALLEAVKQRTELLGQIETLQTEIEAANKRLEDAITARDEADLSWQDAGGVIWDYDSYLIAMESYWNAVTKAQQEVDSLTQQERELNAAFSENETLIEDLADSYDDLASSSENAASAEEQAASRISDKLKELAKAYKDAYDSPWTWPGIIFPSTST